MRKFEIYDQQIRKGNSIEVKKELQTVDYHRLKKHEIHQFANLCRRTGLIDLGLLSLRKHIFLKSGFNIDAKFELINAYCQLLLKIGAADLTIKIMNDVKLRSRHYDPLTMAYSSMALWRMDDAQFYLKEQLSQGSMDLYQTTLTQLNLAGVLRFLGKSKDSLKILFEVRETCIKNDWNLLKGNANELMGLNYFDLDVPEKSISHLKAAEKLLSSSNSRYINYVNIWESLLKLRKAPFDSEALETIGRVRKKAHELKLQHNLRTIDLQVALIQKNNKSLIEVLINSPYKDFRSRYWPKEFDQPDELGPFKVFGSNEAKFNLFLKNGLLSDPLENKYTLSPTLFRLTRSLFCDSYRPLQLGQVFCEIYPGEYFNPEVSPRRIYVAVQRLRTWWQNYDETMLLQFQRKTLSLSRAQSKTSNVAVLVDPDYTIGSNARGLDLIYQRRLDQLRSGEKNEWSFMEVSQRLNVSKRSIKYFLKKSIESNDIEKIKMGRRSIYKLKAS
ncbi:MAG: hypothetical protein KDD61_17815 [Bdellovibrionales bacterium]|nr:hypothetical protein [Bdellovibrionales bacterium]